MSAEFDTKTQNHINFDGALARPLSPSNAPAGDDELLWELLSLYADGEAAPAEAAQVEQMLRHDAEYVRAYAFMRQAGGAVRSIVEVEPPAYLRGAILAKTTQRVPLARRAALAWGAFRGRFVAPVGRLSLAGGGLAAAALLIGVYVGHSEPQQANNLAVAAVAHPHTAPAASRPNAAPFKYELPDPTAFAPMQASSAPAPPAVTKPEAARDKIIAANTARTGAVSVSANAGVPHVPALAQNTAPTGPLAAKAADSPASPIAKKPDALPARTSVIVASLPAHPKRSKMPTPDGDDAQYTQNLFPMMDSTVQHRAVTARMDEAASGEGDNLDDGKFVTSHDSQPAGAVTDATDGDNPDSSAHHLVGKLQLAKLPPASRHLLSPSEIVRQANAAAMRYSAAATDVTPHREADVPVMTLKY